LRLTAASRPANTPVTARPIPSATTKLEKALAQPRSMMATPGGRPTDEELAAEQDFPTYRVEEDLAEEERSPDHDKHASQEQRKSAIPANAAARLSWPAISPNSPWPG